MYYFRWNRFFYYSDTLIYFIGSVFVVGRRVLHFGADGVQVQGHFGAAFVINEDAFRIKSTR